MCERNKIVRDGNIRRYKSKADRTRSLNRYREEKEETGVRRAGMGWGGGEIVHERRRGKLII